MESAETVGDSTQRHIFGGSTILPVFFFFTESKSINMPYEWDGIKMVSSMNENKVNPSSQ